MKHIIKLIDFRLKFKMIAEIGFLSFKLGGLLVFTSVDERKLGGNQISRFQLIGKLIDNNLRRS